MKSAYPHLLSPLVIRGKVIKNRMESANSLPHFLQGPERYPPIPSSPITPTGPSPGRPS